MVREREEGGSCEVVVVEVKWEKREKGESAANFSLRIISDGPVGRKWKRSNLL